jgi:hypothetical protein
MVLAACAGMVGRTEFRDSARLMGYMPQGTVLRIRAVFTLPAAP